jgi:hypothetical protein
MVCVLNSHLYRVRVLSAFNAFATARGAYGDSEG